MGKMAEGDTGLQLRSAMLTLSLTLVLLLLALPLLVWLAGLKAEGGEEVSSKRSSFACSASGSERRVAEELFSTSAAGAGSLNDNFTCAPNPRLTNEYSTSPPCCATYSALRDGTRRRSRCSRLPASRPSASTPTR